MATGEGNIGTIGGEGAHPIEGDMPPVREVLPQVPAERRYFNARNGAIAATLLALGMGIHDQLSHHDLSQKIRNIDLPFIGSDEKPAPQPKASVAPAPKPVEYNPTVLQNPMVKWRAIEQYHFGGRRFDKIVEDLAVQYGIKQNAALSPGNDYFIRIDRGEAHDLVLKYTAKKGDTAETVVNRAFLYLSNRMDGPNRLTKDNVVVTTWGEATRKGLKVYEFVGEPQRNPDGSLKVSDNTPVYARASDGFKDGAVTILPDYLAKKVEDAAAPKANPNAPKGSTSNSGTQKDPKANKPVFRPTLSPGMVASIDSVVGVNPFAGMSQGDHERYAASHANLMKMYG